MPVSPRPGIAAIASIGEMATAVTPMMTGSRMPNGPTPIVCTKRRDAAGEQIGVDQQCEMVLRQMQRPAQDKRHGHGVGIHDEDVLQAERYHTRRGQDLIDWMD